MNKASIIKIFEAQKEVKLAYLFGSHARGESGPNSDYDFAIYLDEKDPSKRFQIRLKLMGELADELKTDKVDLVVLNDLDAPELSFGIISEGELLYEVGAYQLDVEPKIMNEYFDFKIPMRHHNLTKV
jgi:predicted nucleotidyltransferase